MALSADTVWEVRTDGDDGNGGGFVTGASGVDRSQQAASHATLSMSSVVHTTTTQINVDAGDHTVHADDVGNILQVTGGTATAGFYQITAVDTGNNRWTVDRSVGTAAQTVAGDMGGALGSPGKAAKAATVSGHYIWVRSGTYTLSTSTPGAGGPAEFVSAVRVIMTGYESTRGDYGAKPVLDAGAQTSITLFATNGTTFGAAQQFVNLEADGNSGSGNNGFVTTIGWGFSVELCDAVDCPGVGFAGSDSDNESYAGCRAISCGVGFSIAGVRACEAIGCTSHGFDGSGDDKSTDYVDCIAYGNGGNGFNALKRNIRLMNCTADGNTGAGFQVANVWVRFVNCLATNNGGYGWVESTGTFLDTATMLHCAGYNNTSGNRSRTPAVDVGFIALSADPYVDQANDDFRPNDTAGGGAELRAGGLGPASQTNNRDIGAVQHSDPAGGGGRRPRMVTYS